MPAGKDIQTIEKPDSPSEPQQEEVASLHTRRELTRAVTSLLIILSVIAAFQKGALPVLDKLLPLVAIIFGFFFGHKTNR
jgi:hypothetical protein